MSTKRKRNTDHPLFEVSAPPPFSTIGLFTFLRTYARRHDEDDAKSTIESWHQCIERVVTSCNSQLKVGFSEDEMKELFNLLYSLKCSVAGRFMWQLGTRTVDRLGLPSLQNCSFVVVDEPVKPFTWTMNFLMLGSGVGYRILPEDVDKLPVVKYALITRKDTKDADYVVPDSREGWIKLLGKVLKAHFYSGQNFTYSCTLLRSKGAPIKSFGGLASGPEILCDGMEKISSVLNKRVGQKIRPVDALDIMNIIGYIVVSGNVRRSAQLAMGDCKDPEFLGAKDWSKGNIPNWRCYSNNSIVCNDINEVLDNDDFWKGYEGNGEPYGLINLKLSRSCGRLGETQYPDPGVDGYNPCLTGDTMILTSEGLRTVSELVDVPFKAVVNGVEYDSTDVGFWKTGTKPVYKIILSNGLEIKATDNHKFYVQVGKKVQDWKEVQDLELGDKLILGNNNGYEWKSEEGTFSEGYFIGQLIGDGTFSTTKQGDEQPIISMWIPDEIGLENYGPAQNILALADCLKKRCDANGFRDSGVHGDGYKQYRMKIAAFREIAEYYGVHTSEKCVYEKGSYEFSRGMLQGFFDSDGSVQGDQKKGVSVRLCQSDLGRLQAVQRLLFAMGIYSTIYQNRREAGKRLLPDGHGSYKDYDCKATHELVISKNAIIKFADIIGFSDNNKSRRLTQLISQYKRKPNKTHFISEIIDIVSCNEEDVYDCTINTVHCFSANGIISHNCAEQGLNSFETCCLSELYLPNIQTKEELFTCAKYMYRICKHSLLLPCTDSKDTERVVHKNMRMGIGVTGYLQATEQQKGWLSDCYKFLREFDREYSIQHGFPTSIKLTTCKPSGTLSLLGGCTSGIHPGFAQYYKRRIRIASESALLPIAKKHGYPVEFVKNFDGTMDHTTQIITFPYKLPMGTILAEQCSAIDQLEWVKRLQTEWSDNSVSVTVYYRKHELPEIKEWLRNNYNTGVKTVSFLLHSDHGFIQAPLEAMTKEEYDELASQCKPITELEGICYTEEKLENLGGECASGACPLK